MRVMIGNPDNTLATGESGGPSGGGGRITAITPTTANPLRATVKVGGRAKGTLSLDLIDELGLTVGQTWDGKLAERVRRGIETDKAYRQTMQRLNRRAMSRHQLDRKLRELGHDAAVAADVLDRLERAGLIDDRALGAAMIRETISRKPAGPRLLRSKLAQRGLARKLIDELLAEVEAGGDPVGQAAELARQRLARMGDLDERTRKRRLWGVLARRGFAPDVIERALAQLGEAADS